MLFNSPEFLFVFLPLVVIAYHLLLARSEVALARLLLIGASLIFYAWWDVPT